MLYDPKWTKEAETRADPLLLPISLPGLIAWLETQDPNASYDYGCKTGECMVHQYLRAAGHPWKTNPNNYWVAQGAIDRNGRVDPNQIAVGLPRTFGAALTRARKVLAERAD